MSGPTLSIGIPNFGGWCGGQWGRLLDVARACEDAGVDRVVVNDHVVMGNNTGGYTWGRFPTAPDGPWLEPLAVLGAMAAVTSSIRLSTGVLIAPLRPAPLLAKAVATLDVLSAGRVDLGVGVGWQREEYDAVGLDFAARGGRLEETVAACRALWSQSPASYDSPSTSFRDVFCFPQPVQQPLPVWFAGTLNRRNLRRIVELGDGWIPIMGATVDDVREGAARLAAAAARPVTVQAALPPRTGAGGRRDPVATAAGAGEWLAAGATDVYLHVAAFAADPDEAVPVVAQIATTFRGVAA